MESDRYFYATHGWTITYVSKFDNIPFDFIIYASIHILFMQMMFNFHPCLMMSI
jgi:hypothetical protein